MGRQDRTVYLQAQYTAAGKWPVPNFGDVRTSEAPLAKPLAVPRPRGRPKTTRGRGRTDAVKAAAKRMRAERNRPQTIFDLTLPDDDDDDESDVDDEEENKESETPRRGLRDTEARRAHVAAEGFRQLPGSGAGL